MKMKKLSTVLAASALSVVATQAAALDIVYSVDVDGTASGAATGTILGGGTSVITVDTADLTIPGIFTMDTDVASSNSTAFGSLTADISSTVTGTFDAAAFLATGVLTITATTTVTSCTDTSPPVYGNTICGNLPAGSSPFVPLNMVLAPDYSVVTFDTALLATTPLGDVNTSTTYTLTAVPVPAAAWLFGSALVGLAGIGRKRKMA